MTLCFISLALAHCSKTVRLQGIDITVWTDNAELVYYTMMPSKSEESEVRLMTRNGKRRPEWARRQ